MKNYINEKLALNLVLLVIVVCLIVVLYGRHSKRVNSVKASEPILLQKKIDNLVEKNKRLENISNLGRLLENWKSLINEAKVLNLEIMPTNSKFYRGGLPSWSGVVKGDAFIVLHFIKHFQDTMPFFVYEYKVLNGSIELYFSVLGEE